MYEYFEGNYTSTVQRKVYKQTISETIEKYRQNNKKTSKFKVRALKAVLLKDSHPRNVIIWQWTQQSVHTKQELKNRKFMTISLPYYFLYCVQNT